MFEREQLKRIKGDRETKRLATPNVNENNIKGSGEEGGVKIISRIPL